MLFFPEETFKTECKPFPSLLAHSMILNAAESQHCIELLANTQATPLVSTWGLEQRYLLVTLSYKQRGLKKCTAIESGLFYCYYLGSVTSHSPPTMFSTKPSTPDSLSLKKLSK